MFAVAAVFTYYAPTVPTFESMADYQPKLGSKIFSADNQLIGEFAAERRVLVSHEQIPPLFFKALVTPSMKDSRAAPAAAFVIPASFAIFSTNSAFVIFSSF